MKTKHFLAIILLFIAYPGIGQDKVTTTRLSIGKYIKIKVLSRHLYQYTCSNGQVPSNGLIFIDNKEGILVDAPDGDGITDSLLSWMTNDLGVTIKGVIITHWHKQDRMGGISAAKQLSIPTYGSDRTISIGKQENRAYPDHGFSDSLVLKVGNKEILCFYPGPGHTQDNIVVWFPGEKVLFGGCLVKDMTAKNLGYTNDADMENWPLTIKGVIARFADLKIVVPGHYGNGGKKLLLHTLDLLKKK